MNTWLIVFLIIHLIFSVLAYGYNLAYDLKEFTSIKTYKSTILQSLLIGFCGPVGFISVIIGTKCIGDSIFKHGFRLY